MLDQLRNIHHPISDFLAECARGDSQVGPRAVPGLFVQIPINAKSCGQNGQKIEINEDLTFLSTDFCKMENNFQNSQENHKKADFEKLFEEACEVDVGVILALGDEELGREQEDWVEVEELVADVVEKLDEKKTKTERNVFEKEYEDTKNRKEQCAEPKGEGENGADIVGAVVRKEVVGVVEEFGKNYSENFNEKLVKTFEKNK